MAARFRKLDPRIWSDERFRLLNSIEKLIAFYVITAQSNRIGLFNFSPGKACEDLSVSPQIFRIGFEKVCQTLRWNWDNSFRVLFIGTWWKYNCSENPNVLKSCLTDLHDLPNTPLLTKFSENLNYLPESFHQTFREGLPKPSPQPSANQEQEQERGERRVEQESETPPAVDHEFDEFWNLYPMRNGKRVGKPEALKKFQLLSPEDRLVVLAAVQHYATSELVQKGVGIMDAHRWLRNGKGHEPWRDWIEPEQRATKEVQNGRHHLPRIGFTERDYREGAF